jgi:hypothetical protein
MTVMMMIVVVDDDDEDDNYYLIVLFLLISLISDERKKNIYELKYSFCCIFRIISLFCMKDSTFEKICYSCNNNSNSSSSINSFSLLRFFCSLPGKYFKDTW